MAEETDYLVPGSLATPARFQRRYPQLCQQRDPVTIQETLIEATAHLEDITSRRLAPFENIIYENMLNGINPDEYGDGTADMPVGIQGSLGMSYANALGANDLVRNFFLDQYAPAYSELWTYDIQSILLSLTFGNTQPITPSAVWGPEVNTGFMRLALGTFAPEATRIQIVYSGGYTKGIPGSLQRACMMQAAKFMVLDGTQAMRDGTNLNELSNTIDTLLMPWMRY